MRDDITLMLDMLIASRDIRSFVDGVSEAEFRANRMLQSAIIREIQVIGEATRMITTETKTKYPHVEWHEIAGTRNRIVHEYFAIPLDLIWDIVQNHIPVLISHLEKIVPSDDVN
jgi:uncharacterized protein with HEPN domain